jgi:hypothetical protein
VSRICSCCNEARGELKLRRPKGSAGSSTAVLACCAIAALQAGAAASAVANRQSAKTARTLSLTESGTLRLTSKKGFTLNERGSASGTISGPMYIHLRLLPNNRVTAEVNIYPKGSSLTGNGTASYNVVGGYAAFSGTLSISRGSGKYAHAHASGLRFTGKIQRRDDSVSVQLSGPLSY